MPCSTRPSTSIPRRAPVSSPSARGAGKRGGGKVAVTLTGLSGDLGEAARSAADVEAVLDRLDAIDERKGKVVKLRAIWGFETSGIAEALELSLSTVEREWRFGKARLAEELMKRPADGACAAGMRREQTRV